MFGKNTEEDRAKTREDLDEIHALFKDAVTRFRPELDIEAVATGEHWYGSRALELGLIDELGTSDDYLLKASESAAIYAVTWKQHERVVDKLQHAFAAIVDRVGLGPRYPWD